MSALDTYLDAGLVVLPAKGKSPVVPWKDFQPSPDEIRVLFKDNPDATGIWVKTGSASNVAVLDCDNEETVGWWRRQLGPVLDRTARVKSPHGWHFWFLLNTAGFPDWNQTAEQLADGIKFTVRCESGGIMAPPSHDAYDWERDLSEIQQMPTQLCKPAPANGSSGRSTLVQASKLTHEGDRNNQLARFCGHQARVQQHFDGYLEVVRMFNSDRLVPPLDDEEVVQTARSLWVRENDQQQARFERGVEQERFKIRVRREARRRDQAEEAEAIAPTLELVTAADLLARPGAEEPLAWTVDQIFPEGHNVELTGETTLGKTTLMLNLAKALVERESFLGTFATHMAEGRVGIWNYEVTERQFTIWLRDLGMQHPERIAPLTLRGKRLDLMTEAGQEWAVRWLAMHDVRVWMLDPWAEVLANSGLEENANTEARRLGNNINFVKERAGVLGSVISSHTGRQDKERSRGAQALDDWADTMWLMVKDDAEQRFFGTRGGRDVRRQEWRLEYDHPTRRLAVVGGDRTMAASEAVQARVLAVVADKPGATARTLREEVGGDKDKLKEAVERLVAGSLLRTERDTGSSHATRHFLTNLGRVRVAEQQRRLAL